MTIDLSLLEGIPEQVLPTNIKSIEEIKGGLNNRNILINNSHLVKEYLSRDEINDPVRLRFLREKEAFSVLKSREFIPNLVTLNENYDQYHLVRKWVEGRTLTLERIRSQPEIFVKALSKLHCERYSYQYDYDYFDVIKRYIREYKNHSWPQNELLPKVETIESFFQTEQMKLKSLSEAFPITRIHGDLVFSNIIIPHTNNQCIFIDWEYTTSGIPLIDLAYFFTQNLIPKHTQERLIALYEDYCSIKVDLSQLYTYCNLMNLMSGLWYALQVLHLDSTKPTHAQNQISRSEFQQKAYQIFSKLI